jgi:uroporphyrinogen-III synthase
MSRRVLITREFAEPLAGMLAAAGLVPVHVPLVVLFPTEVAPPMGVPDTVVITSAAVARFVPRLPKRLNGARVCAVGKATADALEEIGVVVDLIGDAGGADLIANVRVLPGDNVWYIGAKTPSVGVRRQLSAMPSTVHHWPVYENRCPQGVAEALARALPVDAITFTSPSAAIRFTACVDGTMLGAKVVSIGHSTSLAVVGAGMTVAAQPETPSLQAMVAAVSRVFE